MEKIGAGVLDRLEETSPGWMKLNVDGSMTEVLETTGVGGLVRDENGIWQVLKILQKRFNNLDPNRTIKSTNLTIIT